MTFRTYPPFLLNNRFFHLLYSRLPPLQKLLKCCIYAYILYLCIPPEVVRKQRGYIPQRSFFSTSHMVSCDIYPNLWLLQFSWPHTTIYCLCFFHLLHAALLKLTIANNNAILIIDIFSIKLLLQLAYHNGNEPNNPLKVISIAIKLFIITSSISLFVIYMSYPLSLAIC